MKLDDFVGLLWKQLPVTSKTIDNYQGAYRRYVQPKYGTTCLKSVSKAEWIEVLAQLNVPSRFQTLMMLRTIYREAIDRQIGIENIPPDLRVEPMIGPEWIWPNDIAMYEKAMAEVQAQPAE